MTSRNNRRNRPILVSAHDLGGANQLLYATRKKNCYHYALTGPALQVARSLNLENVIKLNSIDLADYSELYVASNLHEQYSDSLMKDALSRGNFRVTGFLDHWVNFDSRWINPPHKVVVSDVRAYLAAFVHFGFRVRLRTNHYLKALKQSQSTVRPAIKLTTDFSVLVLLQPLANDFRHTEGQGTCFCDALFKFLEKNTVRSLNFREHVETDSTHCREYLARHFSKTLFTVSEWKSGIESDLARAEIVIGIDSYALFIARKLDKSVYSIGGRRSMWSPKYPLL